MLNISFNSFILSHRASQRAKKSYQLITLHNYIFSFCKSFKTSCKNHEKRKGKFHLENTRLGEYKFKIQTKEN